LWALAKVANQGVWINMGGKRVAENFHPPIPLRYSRGFR
jgi:hypothetical protein